MELLEFWTICSSNGIVMEKEQIDIIERYQRDLLYWNQKVNLISRKDESHILDRHILHSLSLLTKVDIKKKSRCLDFGTGGGFPGLPIKIARPDIHLTLVDSIAKKMTMTEMFAQHTGLRNIHTHTLRIETLVDNKQFLRSFDVVMARAVAPVNELIRWTFKLLKPDGCYAFLKGGDLTEEIFVAQREFPNFTFEVEHLKIRGIPWFEEQEKKIVIARPNK